MICEDEINYEFLEKIAKKLSPKDIELVFVDDVKMKIINKEQRNIDKTTDVLSFPFVCEFQALALDPQNSLLGSIVINLDEVHRKATQLKHSKEDEISLLFIHGCLHLLGFDHEVDEGQMRAKEQELIEFFKLPKSLILRND
ncbi:rRNA maturation RNase YbeY [Campylobacter sp. MIT 99-7217]|uniref:rRNA maturation RNase YbeY n=1 Tax=Campylobacter sp. MIT 99-7217 TaxID=535091 RepID=UPI0039182D2A